MFEKFRKMLASHWHVFTLMAIVWFFGYGIASRASTPWVALYYVMHILAGCTLSALAFLVLLPSKPDRPTKHFATDAHVLTRRLHGLFFYLFVSAPVVGVLVFFVPAGPWHLSSDGSFWLTHVYNDNLAHLVHGALFYLVLLLGPTNWLWLSSRVD